MRYPGSQRLADQPCTLLIYLYQMLRVLRHRLQRVRKLHQLGADALPRQPAARGSPDLEPVWARRLGRAGRGGRRGTGRAVLPDKRTDSGQNRNWRLLRLSDFGIA